MKYSVVLILLLACIQVTYAQKAFTVGFDTIIHSFHSPGFCKVPAYEFLLIPKAYYTVKTLQPTFIAIKKDSIPAKPALISVHGNVMYDYFNQAYVDTPYTGKRYYQHTIQAGVDILYKGKYPFTFTVNRTINNSPFIKSWTGANLSLNVESLKRHIRQQVVTELEKKMKEDSLNILLNLIKEKLGQLSMLQRPNLNADGLRQKMVELKERELYGKPALQDSLYKLKDSLANQITAIDSIHLKIDSLQGEIAKYQNKYREMKMASDDLHQHLNEYLNGNYDATAIKPLLDKYHISDTILPKGYQNLLCIKTLAIGKTVINYSELTAKNLLLSGVAVELTKKYYIALSGGMIDYRFRNYFMPMNENHGQYAVFARFGKKISEKSEAIITYYQGRKQLYNYNVSDSTASEPNFNLLGTSLLVNHHFNRNHTIGLEVAKSSAPYYAANKDGQRPASSLFQSQHNTAYGFSFSSLFPRIHGSLNGNVKYYGVNFQSFSILNNGSNQLAYQVKWDHTLLKNDLGWGASVQRNSFSNPYVEYNYSTSTTFASVYARYHHKNLPSFFVSFSPSSQIVKLSDDHFQENVFYSFNASVSHQYKLGGNHAMTSFLYSRFYNRAADSGFVYFNTKNWIVSNACQFGKWLEQANVNYSTNTNYSLWVLENVLQFQCRQWLTLEAGCKWNRQTVYNEELWGYKGGIRIKLSKLGELQGLLDRSYLPGMEKKLVKNNMGRITFTKTF
jgi:hypothetical protein